MQITVLRLIKVLKIIILYDIGVFSNKKPSEKSEGVILSAAFSLFEYSPWLMRKALYRNSICKAY